MLRVPLNASWPSIRDTEMRAGHPILPGGRISTERPHLPLSVLKQQCNSGRPQESVAEPAHDPAVAVLARFGGTRKFDRLIVKPDDAGDPKNPDYCADNIERSRPGDDRRISP